MYVSQENELQTRARLLRVIAAADLEVHAGTFAFTEYPADAFPVELIGRALAFVRDADVWSVLAPARGAETVLLGVLSFHFRADSDNSGFVGWLASHLKSRLGTGVLVVCGSNTMRGGIFDYWAVPHALFPAALAEIAGLRRAGALSPRDPVPREAARAETFSLDGVAMQVTSTASSGVVDARTRIAFRQYGGRVLGRYAGGEVQRGWLVGAIANDRLAFRYVQAESGGAIHGGRSSCEINRQPDGRLRILEHFTWSTRSGRGTNVFEQIS